MKRKNKTRKGSQSRTKKWLKRTSKILVLCGIAFGAHYGWKHLKTSPQFSIREIVISGNQKAQKEEILYLSGLEPGENIFSFSLSGVKKSIEYHPWVKSARIRKELPDRVVIEIKEEEPVAIICLGELYYLNPELKIFKKLIPEDSLEYPIFTGISYQQLKDPSLPFQEWVRKGVEIWEIAQKSALISTKEISEFHLHPEIGMSLVLESGPEVLLGGKNLVERFKKLLEIKLELGRDFYLLNKLDLSNPERVVARFWSGGSEEND